MKKKKKEEEEEKEEEEDEKPTMKKNKSVTFNPDIVIHTFPNFREERYNTWYYDMCHFRRRISLLNDLLKPIFNKRNVK